MTDAPPYDSPKPHRRWRFNRAWLAACHDLVAAGASVYVAYVMRLGVAPTLAILPHVSQSALLFALIAALTFRAFNMYRGMWRFASVADLVTILKAATLAILIFIPVYFQLFRLDDMPRTLPVIQWMALIMMLGGSRLTYRLWRDTKLSRRSQSRREHVVPMLLVGTNRSASLFIRSVAADPFSRYEILGILAESHAHAGRSIHGIPVFGSADALEETMMTLAARKKRPQRLVFCDGVIGPHNRAFVQDIALRAEKLGLKLSRMPAIASFDDTDFNTANAANADIRPVAIEDLLGRPQAPLDLDAISAFIGGKRIVVTGAGGSIGSELVRQITQMKPSALMLIDNCEYNLYACEQEMREKAPMIDMTHALADVRDAGRMAALMDAFKPHVVFHAAALKHVPIVEDNPCEGVLTNIIGTRNVADAACLAKAEAFVLISTDKAVNPSNVMGATKRMAEYYVQALDLDVGDTQFITVRFGNVLGSSGSVVPLFSKQIAAGGPLTVTHPDITRFFMTIREAVGLVLQASAHTVGDAAARGRILVLDMGEPVKIADMARRMIRLAGFEPDKDIKIIYSGLRAGEKLYEELFDASESLIKTRTPGTMAAAPKPITLAILRRGIDTLHAAAACGDAAGVRHHLAAIVPGYVSAATSPTPQGTLTHDTSAHPHGA